MGTGLGSHVGKRAEQGDGWWTRAPALSCPRFALPHV